MKLMQLKLDDDKHCVINVDQIAAIIQSETFDGESLSTHIILINGETVFGIRQSPAEIRQQCQEAYNVPVS